MIDNHDKSGKTAESQRTNVLDAAGGVYQKIPKQRSCSAPTVALCCLRCFREALSEMGKLKDKLALTDTVVEVALSIYRKALEKDLVNRRSVPIFTASAMYAACRNTAAQRNLKDMEIAAGIKRKDIAKCYRLLVGEMDLKMPVTDSTQYVARIASRADLSEKIKRCAIKILKEAQKHEFSAGKDPMGTCCRSAVPVMYRKRL